MSVEAIGLVTLALGLLTLWMGQGATVIAFIAIAVLGSAAALFIGPNNVLPAHLFMAVLMAAVLLRRKETNAFLRAYVPPEPGFWLAGLVIYGVCAAFVLPRILEGSTQIIALGTTQYGSARGTVPLAPVSSNITQSVYMIADLISFGLVVAIGSTRDGFRAVTIGLLAYGVANTVFALIDLATFYSGTSSLLEPIRNARYQLHNDAQMSGMKRIVGSFTEASSFARSTLGVLGLTGTLWLCGRYSVLTGLLALASFVLLLLSTSSTALVGIPVVMALLYITAIYIVVTRKRRVAWAVVTLLPLLTLAVVIGVFLNPYLAKVVWDFLDLIILNKLGSDSGVERSSWNVAALQNFFDSWGLGVGIGTTRSSNILLAILSSVGIVGMIFYLGFLFSVFVRVRGADRSPERDIWMAARNACLGLLVGDLLVSPVVDQGLFFYVLAGVAAAIPLRAARQRQAMPTRWEAA